MILIWNYGAIDQYVGGLSHGFAWNWSGPAGSAGATLVGTWSNVINLESGRTIDLNSGVPRINLESGRTIELRA